MIVSVSRRCDIPRFAFDWFLEKLDAGFADVRNPYNPRQVRRVSLLPAAESGTDGAEERVEVFAFWTRDPAPILRHAGELEERGYPFYVMTTLTAYPEILEPNPPEQDAVIKAMAGLAEKISPEKVIWRYDPVFLSNLTDYEFHRRNFARLAGRLKGSVKRVIVSVYDEYAPAEKRLGALEQNGRLRRLAHYVPGEAGTKRLLPEPRELLSELAAVARREGMEIQSCAEEDLSDSGVSKGACVDGEYLARYFGLKNPGKDRGQKRPGCLCAKSADIGSYGNCPAGCVYCYGALRRTALEKPGTPPQS